MTSENVTSSSHKSYNIMALRGANIDDQEYVEMFSLPANVAYTPQINEVMLDMTYEQNLAAGIEPDRAKELRQEAAANIKRLLAKNGMLKKETK